MNYILSNSMQLKILSDSVLASDIVQKSDSVIHNFDIFAIPFYLIQAEVHNTVNSVSYYSLLLFKFICEE